MRFRLQLIAVPVATLLVACGGDGGTTSPSSGTSGTPSTPTTPTTPDAPVQTNAVQVGNNSFSPANIQVSPGTTVTWTWGSGADIHNVSFSDGQGSGNKAAGSVFTRTFTTTGTFNYQCTLHGGMSGSVLVK